MNVTVTDIAGGPGFDFASIRGAIPLVANYNQDTHDDVLLWRSEWTSTPIMWGRQARGTMSSSNISAPFNLINSR